MFTNMQEPIPIKPVRMGVLTPSSNTALEPLIAAMLAPLPAHSAHFSRFRVTEIALDARALGQFDDANILAAAELLADAEVDVIGWSGTSAGWLGFERDQRLCERIRAHTGIPATSAVQSLNELLRLRGITTLGLVSPYTADVQDCIKQNYRAIGVDVVAERHLGIRDNHEFGMVEPTQLAQMFGEVAGANPAAISTYCTNLRAAALAPELEARHGVPLLDTVSTTVWGLLRLAGSDPSRVTNWGKLFQWT